MSGCFGRGEGIGHAGELLQGALHLEGAVKPFLVTLPVAGMKSVATARWARDWSVRPGARNKALRAARAACARWEVNEAMEIVLESRIPVGRGCGSSTADCVAAVRAVAGLVRRKVRAEEIAEIVHEAEAASDATMFGEEPLAFLPREGRVLRRFDGRWPEMDVSVVDLGGAAVDTDSCAAPEYAAWELEEFARLLARVESAFARGDGEALARVAMRSAEMHQRHRPHWAWPALRERAMREGAWGVALAHSGTVAAVLGAPATRVEEAALVDFASWRG